MNAPVLTDASTAFLPIYAEDAFTLARQGGSGALMYPPADARLEPAWTVRAVITASDVVLGKGLLTLGSGCVFYGWVLESTEFPGEFAIDIRGTISLPEWLKDAEFAPRPHPVVGQVEQGFWSIYATMGINGTVGHVADDLAKLLKDATSVTVTGHSLGAALALLLSFDLAAPERLGRRVQPVVFASPRPGDGAFGKALLQRAPTHRAYAYELDVVPRVPFGFAFESVPGTVELSMFHPGTHVEFSLACNHHALTYATLIDRTAFARFSPIGVDQPFLNCISLAA